jgi:5'-AMP-activated protein kinase, catalytic alpha subunit
MLVQPHGSNKLKDVQAAFSTEEKDDEINKVEHAGESFEANKLECIGHNPPLERIWSVRPIWEWSRAEGKLTVHDPKASVSNSVKGGADCWNRVLQGEETGRNGKAAGVQEGWKGQLGIDVEIFEVTPAFYVVEVKKSAGETLEYEFCNKDLRPSLKDIYWTSQPEGKPSLTSWVVTSFKREFGWIEGWYEFILNTRDEFIIFNIKK